MQANASECKQIQADASKYTQILANVNDASKCSNANKCKQMQASTSKYKQMQANASKSKHM